MGSGLMQVLSPEELQELRKDIAALGIADDRKDDLIRFLDAIAISFIDQAFGFSSVQLSLSALANYAFNGAKPCANLRKSKTLELVDLHEDEGAINTISPASRKAGRQILP